MNAEDFLQDLGLPINADMAAVEQAFMEKIKARLQHVVENYDETEVQAEEEWLRGYLKLFFGFSLGWVAKEVVRCKDVKEFSTAPALKQQARSVVAELQAYITEFASCYMHINRFMTLLRDEIKTEEIRMVSESPQKIRWTSDSGAMIARYRKEKKALLARTERMGRARALLEPVENNFSKIRQGVAVLFGKDKAEPYARSFTAAVRMTDFRKAHKALKAIDEAKKKFGLDQKTITQTVAAIQSCGEEIIAIVEKEQEILMGQENKVFLRPIETDMAYNADIRELKKIKGFLAKYHLPYMQYKLDTLHHLKDKLLVLNSLESLMTLYNRLIMGIAHPLQDIKAVRLYESEVLNHIKYLLQGHFTELPNILQRAEETVREFRQNSTELEEFEQLDLTEIDVGGQAEAQG